MGAKKMRSVEVQCRDCHGTGLYSGFCEGSGVAVVCLVCGGTGCETIPYTPFTERKPKKGIKTVRRSGGTFLATGVGPTGKPISYKEFAKGKMPGGG